MLTGDLSMIKMIDLGVSQKIRSKRPIAYKLRGTSRYLSPEQVGKNRTQLKAMMYATDIWQFACVLLEISTGMEPYSELSNIASMEQISQGQNPL